MRILFVVQRYGEEISGGAEAHCREVATRLVSRGHEVEVVTTNAESYYTWEPTLKPGTFDDHGVAVHRLPVTRTRDGLMFNALDNRTNGAPTGRTDLLYRHWNQVQGPYLPDLADWLIQNKDRFDVVCPFTYLYWTTATTVDTLTGVKPLVLQATAHDEGSFYKSLYDQVVPLADVVATSTPEEARLVEERFGPSVDTSVIGIGVTSGETDGVDVAAEIGTNKPYLLCVGRTDVFKGAHELALFFIEYKKRHKGDLKLVFMGDQVSPLPKHSDIIETGVVSEKVRNAALNECLAMVQPSYFESFSMVLTEAWMFDTPILVQGRCEVTAGHATRSGGALVYEGYPEFEVAVERVVEDESLREQLAKNGKQYVLENYTWDVVIEKYEKVFEDAIDSFSVKAGV